MDKDKDKDMDKNIHKTKDMDKTIPKTKTVDKDMPDKISNKISKINEASTIVAETKVKLKKKYKLIHESMCKLQDKIYSDDS